MQNSGIRMLFTLAHIEVLSIVLNKGRVVDHELIFPAGNDSLISARLVRTL